MQPLAKKKKGLEGFALLIRSILAILIAMRKYASRMWCRYLSVSYVGNIVSRLGLSFLDPISACQ